jgi:acyl-coenzyme A thioesterase PaaI-like protein
VDGLLNPLAPPLRACTDADGLYHGTVRFGGAHEGPAGRVHGGWAAMILDHALARACLSAGHTVMTVSLEVRYRGGTPSHADLEVEASVGGLEGHRRLATGVIRAGGTVTVEATARFAVPRAPAPAPSR